MHIIVYTFGINVRDMNAVVAKNNDPENTISFTFIRAPRASVTVAVMTSVTLET